jgi:hypothetical protein
LAAHNLNHICSFISKTVNDTDSAYVHFEKNFSVTVISWVNGEQLPFAELKRIKNQTLVFAWGKFFA